jgi:hypothetical protein
LLACFDVRCDPITIRVLVILDRVVDVPCLGVFRAGQPQPSEKSATSERNFSADLMFRCQICGTVAPPRTPSHRVVVREEQRTHPSRRGVNPYPYREKGKRKVKWLDDPGGVGPVIAVEVQACAACAAECQRAESLNNGHTPATHLTEPVLVEVT